MTWETNDIKQTLIGWKKKANNIHGDVIEPALDVITVFVNYRNFVFLLFWWAIFHGVACTFFRVASRNFCDANSSRLTDFLLVGIICTCMHVFYIGVFTFYNTIFRCCGFFGENCLLGVLTCNNLIQCKFKRVRVKDVQD